MPEGFIGPFILKRLHLLSFAPMTRMCMAFHVWLITGFVAVQWLQICKAQGYLLTNSIPSHIRRTILLALGYPAWRTYEQIWQVGDRNVTGRTGDAIKVASQTDYERQARTLLTRRIITRDHRSSTFKPGTYSYLHYVIPALVWVVNEVSTLRTSYLIGFFTKCH